MIREVKFESQDRRIKQILACLNAHGIASIEEANQICEAAGLDPYQTCEETQMICFENAKWAYVFHNLQTEPFMRTSYYCLRGSIQATAPSSALKRP